MKEAEAQKPCANLTPVCTGAKHLSNDNEGQENSTLYDLETEPVRLLRSQGGKLTGVAVQFRLINPQNRNFLVGFTFFL